MMTGIKWHLWKELRLVALFLIALTLVACSPDSTPLPDIIAGASKDDVIAAHGTPHQVRDFILPDEPFFGPQESLINLVPSGSLIEEWLYEIEDDHLYIWFSGEQNGLRKDWLVLAKVRVPHDAIY